MSTHQNGEICHFCKRGRFVRRTEQLAFHQWTDKGYVFCRVTASTKVCDQCGSRDWNEDLDKLIDEAVRKEYDKLP